jgi:hypothetical protein
MGWIDRFMGATFVVATLACVPHGHAFAQTAPPTDGARAEFEYQRMIEVAQEARDYVQRRRELLGGLPGDVQPLVSQGQQLLQELRQAIQQRNLARARRIFRQALVLFDEIRLRLNEAMDAQDGATNTPEQIAAKLQRAVSGLRARLGEVQAVAGPSPLPAIAAELARIDGLVRALETPPPGTTPAALRQQVLGARGALQALELLVAQQMEATP